MDEKIMKFLRKNNIHISNIKYLLRQENKTCIYMTDGRVVQTFITVKDLYEILIPYDYISINKGTVVSRGQIDHIENCTYHMKDGVRLEGMDVQEILDQSFYQVFPNGDKKLLAAYTDVAVNGGSCRLKTYSARIHRELIIKCFQPLENFCACILIPAYEIEK